MSDYDDTDYDDTDVEHDEETQAEGGSWEPALREREQRKGKGKRRSGIAVPDHAPRPQDRKPKSAPQREAEQDETVVLEFRGEKFVVPADPDDWHILATQAFSNGRNIDAVQHLLGPRQWARYVAKFTKKRDFDGFAEVVAETFGFGSSGN